MDPQPLTCPRCAGPMFDLDGPAPDPEPTSPVCFLLDGSHYECKLGTCASADQFSCYEYPRVVPVPTRGNHVAIADASGVEGSRTLGRAGDKGVGSGERTVEGSSQGCDAGRSPAQHPGRDRSWRTPIKVSPFESNPANSTGQTRRQR